MAVSLADRQRRIAAHNSVVGALVDIDDTLDASSAVAAPGPLAGVTVVIKANIAQQGQLLSAASAMLTGYRAPADATCTARLREAGASIVGTSNMDEFGMGSSTERSVYGATKNPWDLSRTAGGSSGGAAAAVAAGFCDAALGTDTGGSVRQPAAFCGVVGFKPTYGRISRRGVVAFASSLDQVGVIAADLATTAAVATAVIGPDDGDSTTVDNPLADLRSAVSAGVTGLRVGVLRSIVAADVVDPAIRTALDDAALRLQQAGATVVDVDVALIDQAVAAYYVIATAEASSNLSRYDGVRFGPRAAGASLAEMYEATRAQFGDEVKRRILLGTFVLSHGFYEAYLLQAQKVRTKLTEAFRRTFDDVDLLLLPTTPTLPFALGDKLSDPLAMYVGDLFTLPASLAGLPAISVPVGLSAPTSTSPSLPIGLQLIGRPWDEGTLFAGANAIIKPTPCPYADLP